MAPFSVPIESVLSFYNPKEDGIYLSILISFDVKFILLVLMMFKTDPVKT